MKLQKTSRQELIKISIGVLSGSAIMLGVFAVLKRFDMSVLCGALLGAAIAIFNFYYLAVSVQRAAAVDEKSAKLIMKSSYSMRMLIDAAGVLIGVVVPQFHWVAVFIPLILPRVTIAVMQVLGMYKPDKAEKSKQTDGGEGE